MPCMRRLSRANLGVERIEARCADPDEHLPGTDAGRWQGLNSHWLVFRGLHGGEHGSGKRILVHGVLPMFRIAPISRCNSTASANVGLSCVPCKKSDAIRL